MDIEFSIQHCRQLYSSGNRCIICCTKFTYLETIVQDFGAKQGWNYKTHHSHIADVNNDGTMDIIGFGNKETLVALGNGNASFQKVIPVSMEFTVIGGGWNNTAYERLVVDIDNDGKADLVGFGNNGVSVGFATNDKAKAAPTRQLADIDNRKWMAGIKDEVNLKDLTIPGTQDSGADYGWKITKEQDQMVRGAMNNYLGKDGIASAIGLNEAINNMAKTFYPAFKQYALCQKKLF